MRLFFQYAPIFEHPVTFPILKTSYLWNYFAHKNGSPIKMQVISYAIGICANSNEVQAPYAPIFNGRLLLGMSLFSKKYSTKEKHIIRSILKCITVC